MFSKLRNRLLVWRFPYLKPHRYDGSAIPDYNYDYTDLDCYPDGWRKIIIKYLKRLNKILKEYNELENFYVTDTKEKWGTARLYYEGVINDECRSKIDELLCDMEKETWDTCCDCGKPATLNSAGYILPFCEKCSKQKKHYYLNFEKKDN